jgi:pyruvate dehydrogenase E2 component (dihydrolipoamide acetyltransferase)
MPALGLAQETGKVLKWLKGEGQTVVKGEPLLEIETDKVAIEMEAPGSGVLAGVKAHAGSQVTVGTTIAEIIAPEEAEPYQLKEVSATNTSQGTATLADAALTGVIAQNVTPTVSTHANADSGSAVRAAALRRPPSSPRARRLAVERGINSAEILGTGPGGAVVATDVIDATARPKEVSPSQRPVLSTQWRTMAERTAQSWTSIPHFYLSREARANRLVAWRETIQKRSAEKISYTDLLIQLLAISLRDHPRLNAQWKDGTVLLSADINIGLAVATDKALVVPVICRADQLSVKDIATRRKEAVARAQAGELRPEDVRGATFTLSNLGMYGVDSFQAIIVPPQAAILAVGRIAERVVVVDHRPVVEPTMMITLSCDHRLVDGVLAAEFLKGLVAMIEEPPGLLE